MISTLVSHGESKKSYVTLINGSDMRDLAKLMHDMPKEAKALYSKQDTLSKLAEALRTAARTRGAHDDEEETVLKQCQDEIPRDDWVLQAYWERLHLIADDMVA